MVTRRKEVAMPEDAVQNSENTPPQGRPSEDAVADREQAVRDAQHDSVPECTTSVCTAPGTQPESARPYAAPDLAVAPETARTAGLDLLDDVELTVKIELGRTEMYIEDVLRLGVGSVVELDKLAGDPVDIYVNERLVARGEVLVLNENFCVRVNDILSPVPELETER
jgi:flagellar motor switch protein FliN/FliY